MNLPRYDQQWLLSWHAVSMSSLPFIVALLQFDRRQCYYELTWNTSCYFLSLAKLVYRAMRVSQWTTVGLWQNQKTTGLLGLVKYKPPGTWGVESYNIDMKQAYITYIT